MNLLDLVKETVDAGGSCTIHCHAGVHRAALAMCCVLMYCLGLPWNKARRMVEDQRNVKLDEVLQPRRRDKGGMSEDHKKWIPIWQEHALSSEAYRFLPQNVTHLDLDPDHDDDDAPKL